MDQSRYLQVIWCLQSLVLYIFVYHNLMYYIITIDIAMWLAYLWMLWWLPYLIHNRRDVLSQFKISSLLISICFAIVMWQISMLIADPEWSNRWLHAMGGGVAIALAYHLAAKDSHTQMTWVQYRVIGIMVCNMAGVFNELIEHLAQSYTTIVFASTIWDTWLDLWSNLIGSSIAIIVLSMVYRQNYRIFSH